MVAHALSYRDPGFAAEQRNRRLTGVLHHRVNAVKTRAVGLAIDFGNGMVNVVLEHFESALGSVISVKSAK
jgi:hypothetical protein